MQNLFASNSQYRLAYWLIWAITATAYTAILAFVWKVVLMSAVTDALVFSSLSAIMGIAAWNVVKYSALDSASVFNTLTTHLVAGGVLVFVLVSGGESLLQVFLNTENKFYDFGSGYHIYRLVVGGFIYILMAINFYLIIYYEESRSRKIRQAEMDKHLKSAELNMLKAQINPHFIFNSLNSVSSLTLTNPQKAHEMVIQLADFLRYSIRKNADQLVKLEQEIEAIELFLAIEKIRFGKRLKVAVECAAGSEDKLLPALILQPLIENAIKYSLHETDVDSEIKISCQERENELHILITNNFDKDVVPKKGEGIGLKNVSTRLSLVYNRQDLLDTSIEDDLFKVEIIIPQI
jgi:two-component system LytT family sensor kinase